MRVDSLHRSVFLSICICILVQFIYAHDKTICRPLLSARMNDLQFEWNGGLYARKLMFPKKKWRDEARIQRYWCTSSGVAGITSTTERGILLGAVWLLDPNTTYTEMLPIEVTCSDCGSSTENNMPVVVHGNTLFYTHCGGEWRVGSCLARLAGLIFHEYAPGKRGDELVVPWISGENIFRYTNGGQWCTHYSIYPSDTGTITVTASANSSDNCGIDFTVNTVIDVTTGDARALVLGSGVHVGHSYVTISDLTCHSFPNKTIECAIIRNMAYQWVTGPREAPRYRYIPLLETFSLPKTLWRSSLSTKRDVFSKLSPHIIPIVVTTPETITLLEEGIDRSCYHGRHIHLVQRTLPDMAPINSVDVYCGKRRVYAPLTPLQKAGYWLTTNWAGDWHNSMYFTATELANLMKTRRENKHQLRSIFSVIPRLIRKAWRKLPRLHTMCLLLTTLYYRKMAHLSHNHKSNEVKQSKDHDVANITKRRGRPTAETFQIAQATVDLIDFMITLYTSPAATKIYQDKLIELLKSSLARKEILSGLRFSLYDFAIQKACITKITHPCERTDSTQSDNTFSMGCELSAKFSLVIRLYGMLHLHVASLYVDVIVTLTDVRIPVIIYLSPPDKKAESSSIAELLPSVSILIADTPDIDYDFKMKSLSLAVLQYMFFISYFIKSKIRSLLWSLEGMELKILQALCPPLLRDNSILLFRHELIAYQLNYIS